MRGQGALAPKALTTVLSGCIELDSMTGPAQNSVFSLSSSPGEQYLRQYGGAARLAVRWADLPAPSSAPELMQAPTKAAVQKAREASAVL